ncbi:MAG: ornithine carbamoyltransferase [Rhodospirillaceae bacterium]|jgi:ornithine carbamoyltransferase|nr:ornithine carbamoyltransferase [Rhodospirillaceae bacterium]
MIGGRDFLDIDQIPTADLRAILERGGALKEDQINGSAQPLMAGRTLVMIFEKPSTRTRVSFQVGMQQLGGMVVVMSETDSQLGRGETVADTARVLSRYADIIMIRTDNHQKLLELSEYATVPVINGLTDSSHPCQIMADIMTFEEHKGSIAGRTVSWVGDGNNVSHSWIHAAAKFGFTLKLACPASLQPSDTILAAARAEGADIVIADTPEEAVAGTDLVITDTWVSMGDKDGDRRRQILLPFQVNDELMAAAGPDALFMHCLPAHRGDEVTDSVIDGPQSVIWDEAENRLHAQKGILAWCLE